MEPMKRLPRLILCLLVSSAAVAFSQENSQPATQAAPPAIAKSGLTRFDLDFPGGSPNELVAAIEKATGRPLNAIVPIERASIKMPPLKMKGVDVAELFDALGYASRSLGTWYGFKTLNPNPAKADSSIWFFCFEGASHIQQPGVYLLTPYLDQGLTVDDITTAIQTAWKMQGYSPMPQLSFHKETKLLIAVGEPIQLEVITQVLGAGGAPPPLKPEPPKAKE
jgi:hypothetical protein